MAAAKWPTQYIGADAPSPAPAKAVPDSYWASYEEMCGHNSVGLYVVLVPFKSLAEVDAGFANAKKFADHMGKSGIKKIAETSASSIESIESNLLMFNPKISYPADEWVKARSGLLEAEAGCSSYSERRSRLNRSTTDCTSQVFLKCGTTWDGYLRLFSTSTIHPPDSS